MKLNKKKYDKDIYFFVLNIVASLVFDQETEMT